MLDVDGVLIAHPDEKGWSGHLERDLGLPAAALQSAFFGPHWSDVIHGRASLRDRLTPVLALLSPAVSPDQLINYWFAHDAHINRALLGEVVTLRTTGVEVHLATVQEHERAHHLWEVLGLRHSFDGLHYSADLGHAKPAVGFYRGVEARTGFEAGELLLVDDGLENVEGAAACGWSAALWAGEERLASIVASAQRQIGTPYLPMR